METTVAVLDTPEFHAGCLGKEQHETEAAALAAHGFRVKVRAARAGDGMHPYECGFCGKWHLGHGAAKKRRGAG